jgi:hypothetical protein
MASTADITNSDFHRTAGCCYFGNFSYFFSKVPDLSHVEHVGVSTDRLTIARIMADELTVASTSTAFR